MDLNAVHMLIKVAECKSFTLAANQLSTSQSRISRTIAQLESELGVRLLHRNTRNVSLTPDGCELVDRCAPLIAGLDDARKLLLDRRCEPSGTLRLSAPSILGRVVLTPLLGQLMDRHPQLQIDASFTDRLVDMVDEGFDAAVRIGPLQDSRMIARSLPPLRWVTVASPAYLAQFGTPRTLEDLARHRCLAVYNHYLGRRVPWQFLNTDGEPEDWLAPQSVTFDSGDPLVEGSVSGLGVAQVMEFAVRSHIEAGRLVRLLPQCEGRSRELALVYPRSRQASPKVKVLAQLLLAQDCW
ncbi:LysR family transcriptional regulator [Diaphorobacter ruginosibacter]|uniref:LysR family transcriptional regulator n=1 Tax=Diaphorobacter ruginosibacter TaxID=1715720 RepID=A0A7G9RUD5_9BURK|nr:LysR family transcriptional regulator [Diaphorobacter ruginosibacter]QNN59210.1 LysR family transcriptional regulator [Diaphorobacter ruginosibacter]